MTIDDLVGKRARVNKNYVDHGVNIEIVGKTGTLRKYSPIYGNLLIMDIDDSVYKLIVTIFDDGTLTEYVDLIEEDIQLTTIEQIIANNGKEVTLSIFRMYSNNWINDIEAAIEYNPSTGLVAFISHNSELNGNCDHSNRSYPFSYTYPKDKYHKIFEQIKIFTKGSIGSFSKKDIDNSIKRILKSLKRDEISNSYSLKNDLELNDFEILTFKTELNKVFSVDLNQYPMLDTIGDYTKTLENNLIK
jgi:hypothetical protein